MTDLVVRRLIEAPFQYGGLQPRRAIRLLRDARMFVKFFQAAGADADPSALLRARQLIF
jgi:hypothetical protein